MVPLHNLQISRTLVAAIPFLSYIDYFIYRLLTQSVYPENCKDAIARGIVFDVAVLLKDRKWNMYLISDVPVVTRQVKVFVVKVLLGSSTIINKT